MIFKGKIEHSLRLLIVLTVLHSLPLRAGGAQDASASGSIEGTVFYQADTARPWRYARYYIKSSKTGELAEAVVALRARGVRDAERTPKTVTVDQQNFQFQPEIVAIRRGDAVTFSNSDQATHNVQTSSEIASFNVNTPGGGAHTFRFDKAGGTRQYATIGCVFHSNMRAFVVVFDHPWYTLTPASGKFRLSDVPPGEYDLEMVHPAGELRWKQRVKILPGQTAQVDIRVSPDDKR